MKFSINANMCDLDTTHIADALHTCFKPLGERLSRDYGGEIEQLWIDFELIAAHAVLRAPWKFRYQKKVSPPSSFNGLNLPTYHYVGHYSVRPDFDLLLKLPNDKLISYALQLVYDSTGVLLEKQKKLGAFNVHAFRADFLSEIRSLGCDIN